MGYYLCLIGMLLIKHAPTGTAAEVLVLQARLVSYTKEVIQERLRSDTPWATNLPGCGEQCCHLPLHALQVVERVAIPPMLEPLSLMPGVRKRPLAAPQGRQVRRPHPELAAEPVEDAEIFSLKWFKGLKKHREEDFDTESEPGYALCNVCDAKQPIYKRHRLADALCPKIKLNSDPAHNMKQKIKLQRCANLGVKPSGKDSLLKELLKLKNLFQVPVVKDAD